MNVLVTGASGSIGSRLVQALAAQGDMVRILVRKTSNLNCLKNCKVEICYGDVRDVESLDKALEDVETVYHLAAMVPPSLWRVPKNVVWDINCKGTRNLLEACRARKLSRFVYASTIGVTGYIDHGRADETYPYNPPGLYEKTKCEAEQLVLRYYKEYKIPTTAIRIPAVYGPGLVRGMVEAFQAVNSGRFRFLGTGKSLIHLIYIDDLVEALLLAMKRDMAIGKVYIVGMRDPVTWEEYLNTIADVMGVDHPKGHIPVWVAKMLAVCSETLLRPFSREEPFLVPYRIDWTTRNSAYNVSKAFKELGFEAKTSLKEGIGKTVNWYRKEGYLK